MKETEPYTKVHDFLFTDLKLSEMMARIFSFILTKWIGGIPVYRQRYVAEKCRVSDRECKQIFKCLGHRPDTEDPQGNERDSQLRTCNREMSGHHPGQICTGARHSPVHGVHRCMRRTFKVHTVHFRRCVLCTTNTYK